MEEYRGGYRMRYFFNAGLDKKTGNCDAEGTDFFDEDTDDHIGEVYGYTPSELVEMTEDEFQRVLEDNYIA